MAKMHLLRALSLGPGADDPDTFPRWGVHGGGRERGIPLYAPAIRASAPLITCHAPATAIRSPQRWGPLRSAGAEYWGSLSLSAQQRGRQERPEDYLYWAAGVSKGASERTPKCTWPLSFAR